MTAPDAADLDRRFGRPGAVAFAVSTLGGVVATLTAADGAVATVALTGGHVLSYATPAAGEVLWLSPLARLDTGRAVRGGIPVCWPWFGAHPSEPARPAHGVARTAPWQVVATAPGPAPRLVLALDQQAARASGTDLSAQLEVTLAGALEVSLVTRNEGAAPARLTAALHSYFGVSDIGAVTVGGLEGRPFIDQLDAGRSKRSAEPIRFAGEVDRIYQESPDTVTIDDPGLGRRIEVAKRGSASTVVWNPWVDKAARLGDLGPDGFRRMVCVETANAGGDVVTLAPGATHTLTASIRAVT